MYGYVWVIGGGGLSAMMYRVHPRDSVDRSMDRWNRWIVPACLSHSLSLADHHQPTQNAHTQKKQHVANSLNALARLREGRRRGQQNTATSKGGKGGMGGVKGDDEKALAAAVERFRDRCAVCAFVCASYVSYL